MLEHMVVTMGFCLVTYFIGYRFGYHDCFDYMKKELEEYKKDMSTMSATSKEDIR